jgi:hypothetical protein
VLSCQRMKEEIPTLVALMLLPHPSWALPLLLGPQSWHITSSKHDKIELLPSYNQMP